MLIRYNYPLASPKLEDDILYLKHCEVLVDGYDLQLHYNKADYGTYHLITFQVIGKSIPFLPFNLVFKLARKALGTEHLSLLEIYKDKRKIYCWTLVIDKDGNPMEYPYKEEEVEHLEYEGFEYVYMNPNQAKYY